APVGWAGGHARRRGRAGPGGESICHRAMGNGGLVSMLGLGLIAAGAGVAWRTGRRLVAPGALSGWVAGQGIVIAACGLMVALLIPAHHCPPGYEMTVVFHACRSTTQVPELILHPPSWIGWKFAVAAAAIVVGVIVARWQRLPWPIASALTAGTVATATLLLADRTVGMPRL